MIVVTASMVVNPGMSDQFEEAVQKVTELTRAEDGCLSYECFQSVETPGSYLFYELWRDSDVLDAHAKTPHFAAFFEVVPTVVASSEVLAHAVVDTRKLA